MELKAARHQKTLSQSELAMAIGVTVVMVSRYENGHSIPNPATKRRIEGILGPITWPEQRTQHLRPPSLGGAKEART